MVAGNMKYRKPMSFAKRLSGGPNAPISMIATNTMVIFPSKIAAHALE